MNDRCDPFYGLRQNPAYRSTLAQLFNEIVRLRSLSRIFRRAPLTRWSFRFPTPFDFGSRCLNPGILA
jgi:hypothetical protein